MVCVASHAKVLPVIDMKVPLRSTPTRSGSPLQAQVAERQRLVSLHDKEELTKELP